MIPPAGSTTQLAQSLSTAVHSYLWSKPKVHVFQSMQHSPLLSLPLSLCSFSLHSPVEMSTSILRCFLCPSQPREYNFWEFCTTLFSLRRSVLKADLSRSLSLLSFLFFSLSLLFGGPAVWSIAEVNLGRVTVPFVSLSPCTPG